MPVGKPLILLADDSPEDCKIIEMALQRIEIPCVLKTVADGEQLLQTLKGRGKPLKKGELPDLILLDLNMPIKSGLEALEEIKADQRLRSIPVVVWSTSENRADIMKSYQLGASSFFTKPNSLVEVVATMRVIINYWLCATKLPPSGS